VSLCLIDEPGLKGVPLSQLNIYRRTKGGIVQPDGLKNITADIILDAMIGYGLQSMPKGNYRSAIEFANSSGAEIISLDIPTGINSTTGEDYGSYIYADFTLTLAYPKTGLSESKCGKIFLGDIGIPAEVFIAAGIDYSNPFDGKWIVPIKAKK
jgi:NAD(P)H-hydrate epimerase